MLPVVQNTLHCLSFIHRGWRYRLRVERPEVCFVLKYLKPGQTAVDIGAHRGAFTYWMAKRVGRQGRVLAFEPLPAMAEYLRHIQQVFPLPQLTVEEAALCHQSGRRMLHVPRDDYLGMTSFTPSAQPKGHIQMEVTTFTLDEYVRHASARPVDFIKCDVEGHELEVLQGANNVLREDQPILLLECEDHRNGGGQLERVTRYLSRFDYECFALYSHRIRPLGQCAEEMKKGNLRVGIDAWRDFGFLPKAHAEEFHRTRDPTAWSPS